MGSDNTYNYGVVLDAGSSGTRLYVYRWLKNDIARQGDGAFLKSLPKLQTKKKWTKKIHPGVSTFGEKPERVGPEHLKELLEHALKYIPDEALPNTPIFLLATAGMRLLPQYQQDDLVKNICSYIRTETRLLIPDCQQHVQVISGETEGLYGWLAANYLLGGFDAPGRHDHGKGHHTYGFLDMGGASAQIAFAPNTTEAQKHANDLKLVRLRTVDGTAQEHRVFVTTWLGFGVNEARRRYLKEMLDKPGSNTIYDPCLPPGYRTTLDAHSINPLLDPGSERDLVGSGLFNECLKHTLPLLEKDAPCEDEPCLINGQHVPAIDFDVNHFIGISEYWHTTHAALQLAGGEDTIFDFRTYQSRVKELCEQPWSKTQAKVKSTKKIDEQTAYELCFKSSWLINMLHDGIGIPRIGIEESASNHKNGTKEVLESSKQKGYLDPFQAVDTIGSTEVSWTMGKMALYASANIPPSSLDVSNLLPVGFGSNIPGIPIPTDFEYPGGSKNLEPVTEPDTVTSTTPNSEFITDKISTPFIKSDSSHRIPGFLLFLVIVVIALFYLCGRDRRTRFFARYLPRTSSALGLNRVVTPTKKSHQMSHNRISSLVNRYILRRPRASLEHDRELEEGSTTRLFDPAAPDFELGDFNDSDTDSVAMPELTINGKSTLGSGYATPSTNRPRPSRPGLTSSQSAFFAQAGRLKPDVAVAVDRRGLAVRTESRERLDLGGRKSRSGSLSPTRLRAKE